MGNNILENYYLLLYKMGFSSSKMSNVGNQYETFISKINELIEELYVAGYIQKISDDKYRFNEKICQEIIYYRVDNFLNSIEPDEVNSVLYKLGYGRIVSTDTRNLICKRLTSFIMAKLDLLIRIKLHVSVLTIRPYPNLYKTELTSYRSIEFKKLSTR